NLVILASSEPMTRGSAAYSPDLLNRTTSLTMPPLRERREDIMPAARMLLKLHTAGAELTSSAEAWLLDPLLVWPGNFRDLRRLLLEASLFWKRMRIDHDDLQRAEAEHNLSLRAAGPAPTSAVPLPGTEQDWLALKVRFPDAKSMR